MRLDRFLTGLTISGVSVLAGCAGYTPSILPNEKPTGQEAYLYGRFYIEAKASALALDGHQTIPPDKGLFLEKTWRLHPNICAYTSGLFYEGKLSSRDGLEKQVIHRAGAIRGSGLYYLPVEHDGNQTCSPEEAQAWWEAHLEASAPARAVAFPAPWTTNVEVALGR